MDGSKQCRRCGAIKPRPEFNRCARNGDGLHSYCRKCQAAHYLQNRTRHMRNVRRTSEARMGRMRELIIARFGAGCVDCGVGDFRVLEFDHVRGVKLMNISTMLRRGASQERFIEELDKCDVRCRNCHAIATAARRSKSWFDAYVGDAGEPLREESNPRPGG